MSVGDTVRERLAAGGLFKRLAEAKAPPREILEDLFIRTLSRCPEGDEMRDLLALVDGSAKDAEVYQDIFWSLLNSTEFLFNN